MNKLTFKSEEILGSLNLYRDLDYKSYLSAAKLVTRIFVREKNSKRPFKTAIRKARKLCNGRIVQLRTLAHKSKKRKTDYLKKASNHKLIKQALPAKNSQPFSTNNKALLLPKNKAFMKKAQYNSDDGDTDKFQKCMNTCLLSDSYSGLKKRKQRKQRKCTFDNIDTFEMPCKTFFESQVYIRSTDPFMKEYNDAQSKQNAMANSTTIDCGTKLKESTDELDVGPIFRIPINELEFIGDMLHIFLEKQKFFLEHIR